MDGKNDSICNLLIGALLYCLNWHSGIFTSIWTQLCLCLSAVLSTWDVWHVCLFWVPLTEMKRKARKYALYFSPHSENLEHSINILSSANFLAFLSWRNFGLSYCAQDQTAADKNDSVSYKNEETSTESEVGTSILNTIGCSVVSLKIFFLMFNECQGGKYFKCYSI